MHVVFVASEAVPFAKTGGLGDVIGALPRAIEREGHTACRLPPRLSSRTAHPACPLSTTGITLQIPVGAQTVEGTRPRKHAARLSASRST